MLAISAAGGHRYALGVPVEDPNAAPRRFDLFNLPREVGGLGGLAPLVRACFNGTPKYGMVWRFATPTDGLTAETVDDDADVTDSTDSTDGHGHGQEREQEA